MVRNERNLLENMACIAVLKLSHKLIVLLFQLSIKIDMGHAIPCLLIAATKGFLFYQVAMKVSLAA